jgi:Fe-S cluster assembly protein SufB
MPNALHTHGDLIKDHFMTLVAPSDHKFAALHGAVRSGGTFIYVPK